MFYPYSNYQYFDNDYEQRRRRNQLDRQRREYEIEMRRRRAMELERRSQLEREALLTEQLRRNQPEEDPYKVVRGSDGRLYRVPSHHASQCTKQIHEDRSPAQLVRGQDGRLYFVHNQSSERRKSPSNEDSDEESFDSGRSSVDSYTTTQQSAEEREYSRHAKIASQFPVLVEDASDSEDENDELKSIWRNRRPGPGESWMEPIQ